ncbi:hypothetical protein PCANC_11531 [Puccinia coronata f. sp. avenae]|uniref:Cyclopropane-fatty-acyl-phospholipid synthase n=1 Tax=Puccinia coronata f. sp. avenae TaxID=200324 RepID=A0A2N5UQF7_9BASI|nr:hypothetical protein PCANC_11531 [Puccinia coronata f. sp. avenae]PLW42947.1 hypothetical protein PCASD_04735 [Puccinia coronata f. sp. avenae]
MDQDYLKTKNYEADSGSLLALTNQSLHAIKEKIVNTTTFAPLVLLAKKTIVSLLSKIEHGRIHMHTKQESWTFGGQCTTKAHGEQEEEEVSIQVLSDAFWIRMFLLSDMGFAEAYMVGDIRVDRLDALFKIFIRNRAHVSEMSMLASSLFGALNRLMNSRFINSVSNTLSNISAHYDISNDMFRAFLSNDMTYSCAYFTPDLGGINGDLKAIKLEGEGVQEEEEEEEEDDDDDDDDGDDGKKEEDPLELAQYAKLDLIIEKARIRKGDRVLEIGSGWGSLAIRAVERTGCTVDTITLSVEQKRLAEKRISAAGLKDKIIVHLMDYRDIPRSFERPFDRVVSVEMLESVGIQFLIPFFNTLHRSLHPLHGIAVFQVITIPESRFDRYVKEVDFIRKWIFPGGVLPSVTALTNAITQGSENGQLVIDSVQNIGPHYARTLREWERRFIRNFDQIIAPCLLTTYPELDRNPHRVEIFKRKWIYYFEYCAAGFDARVLGDHIFTLTREGNLTL